MVKASEALGRPVVARQGGRAIGTVKDLVVDPTGQEVIGIVLHRRLFRGERVVPWAGVQVYGPHAVVIDSRAALVRVSDEPDISAALAKKIGIRGLKLVTTHTRKLGRISDIAFDETTGAVTGYELRHRRLYEAAGGVSFLPTPTWIQLGRRSAVVIPESVARLRKDAPMVARPAGGSALRRQPAIGSLMAVLRGRK